MMLPCSGGAAMGLFGCCAFFLTPWLGFGATDDAGEGEGVRVPGKKTSVFAGRIRVCLNGNWEIASGGAEAVPGDRLKAPAGGWTTARIPTVPIKDPTVTAQWHRLVFETPKAWKDSPCDFFLELEKAGHYAAVFCNGKFVGEHFGQFTPFETLLGQTFRPGKKNELVVYVHNASGAFVRPGWSCDDPIICNAYRAAVNREEERNWIGVVGDITLLSRPKACIGDVFVDPSVRTKSLEVSLGFSGLEGDVYSCRATVLDGRAALLDFDAVSVNGTEPEALLRAPWANPVLWGPAPYGEPKLYVLRVELMKNGKVIDRTFTRFGFREVWIEGRDVMLNGKKLWMAGTYNTKLSPIRYLNDRRAAAAMIDVLQRSGLNTYHGHWDDLGRTWLEMCDEAGILVLAEFFCDGRPKLHSRADAGWPDWMTETCAEWVKARRGHSSIVMWRPTDVLPQNIGDFTRYPDFQARLAEQVRTHDPARRPIADGSDVYSWGQPPIDNKTKEYDNWGKLDKLVKTQKIPFLNKEIYTGFQDEQKLSEFFRVFYDKAFKGGCTGMIVQHIPLIERREGGFEIAWPSASGRGNRDCPRDRIGWELPNWCAADSGVDVESGYARLFRGLYEQYLKTTSKAEPRYCSEILVSSLKPNTFVLLRPKDEATAARQGVMSDGEGTAWFVVEGPPGPYVIVQDGIERTIAVQPEFAPTTPGYDYIQRVD